MVIAKLCWVFTSQLSNEIIASTHDVYQIIRLHTRLWRRRRRKKIIKFLRLHYHPPFCLFTLCTVHIILYAPFGKQNAFV